MDYPLYRRYSSNVFILLNDMAHVTGGVVDGSGAYNNTSESEMKNSS